MTNALFIYNLFPPLLGNIKNWYAHIPRIKKMGANALYLNPLHYPGFSGSLYGVKDYYQYNPKFFSSHEQDVAEKELKDFLAYCNEQGVRVLMDLVINHTASDSVLKESHPDWYMKDEDGTFKSPGAWDGETWVEWGDLTEIDNEKSPDRDALWAYWKTLVEHALRLGFGGFRCDAAYQVPKALWVELIAHAKSVDENALFWAENLGCSLDDTKMLVEAGFDYLCTSSRWWDFKGVWCLDHYEATRTLAPSVSFPENHDTLRAITEYKGNINRVKLYTAFTALFTTGWMITLGYEWGFRNRCDVVRGTESDMEAINYDLSDFISRVIALKNEHEILRTEGEIEVIDRLLDDEEEEERTKEALAKAKPGEEVEVELPILLSFYKYSTDKSRRLLFFINTDTEEPLPVVLDHYPTLRQDLSLDGRITYLEGITGLVLQPGEIKIFAVE